MPARPSLLATHFKIDLTTDEGPHLFIAKLDVIG